MHNKLEPIIQQKKSEIADLYQQIESEADHPVSQVLRGTFSLKPAPSFKAALKAGSLSIIAEIKRKSPSKGDISAITDPVALAQKYISGGASALSILTDNKFFNGTIADIVQVSRLSSEQFIPIIRKDFIMDKVQIAEAAVSGASAILLIVAVLGQKTHELYDFAKSINMDVLVEIHDQAELTFALNCGADIIGINNRNLKNFVVDTQHALNIVKLIPDSIIKIAESGITHPAIARQYYEAGFDAVLIGEALVRSTDPAQFIQECRHE